MLIYEYLIDRRFPIPIWILCSILWNLADNEWQGGDEGGVRGNFSKNFQGETTEMLQVWCNWPRRKVSQTCEKSQMFNKLDHQVLLGAANRLHGRLAPFSDWGVGERPGGRHWGPLLPEGFFKSRRKILPNLRWGWMWRMEASTHFWGWKVGRLGTPSSKHSTSRFSLLVKDYDWSRWTRWSIQLWLCFWMMWIMSPIDNLSFLGGEGERNHCEVERGWDVDLRRPFLWEKQLRHLRRVRPLQAQEEGCSLRKFNWHSVPVWKLHIYISRGIN